MISTTALVFTLTVSAATADWGSIKGRFVVNGVPPKQSPLVVSKDQFCMDTKPMDETVVAADDGSLANVVVYIRSTRRDKIDVHPDYAAQLNRPVQLDNHGCHFVPHIALLRSGQPFVLKNSDPVGHNTKVGLFNQIIASGTEITTKIEHGEALPMQVNCNIHPFMKGYVLVQDHPYMAVSAADGKFEIKNVPVGARGFAFWHEAPGPLRNLKVGSMTTDRRGIAELTIKAGETLDLGEIKVPVAVLKTSP